MILCSLKKYFCIKQNKKNIICNDFSNLINTFIIRYKTHKKIKYIKTINRAYKH